MNPSKDRVFGDLAHGQDSVATAGTPVQLNGGTSLPVPDGARLRIRANPGITGEIYIGGSSVSASTGYALDGGASMTLRVDDVATIWLDADTNGIGVSWVVEQES